MKLLAENNIIIVAVIHHPEFLDLPAVQLDYFDAASRFIQHFNSMQYYCPSLFNPADYVLDLLFINVKSSSNFVRT
jgi:hypothetical protein